MLKNCIHKLFGSTMSMYVLDLSNLEIYSIFRPSEHFAEILLMSFELMILLLTNENPKSGPD